MRKIYSSDREKLLKFDAEGQEFTKNFEITCSWSFLRSNKLEQLEFKSEKFIWIQKSTGKVRK